MKPHEVFCGSKRARRIERSASRERTQKAQSYCAEKRGEEQRNSSSLYNYLPTVCLDRNIRNMYETSFDIIYKLVEFNLLAQNIETSS